MSSERARRSRALPAHGIAGLRESRRTREGPLDYATVNGILASLALFAGGAGTLLLALLSVPATRHRIGRELAGEERVVLGLAWGVAAIATAGSLYFSQVVGFTPCVLCWYQRIAMYPLVLVLAVGALTSDGRVWRYGLPLSGIGLLIAAYHIALQNRPALDVGTCSPDVPCTLRYVAVYGFVSIPVMAAGGFLLISSLLLVARTVAQES